MKAKFLKSTLSLALALCMIFSLSSVCFAAEPVDEPTPVGTVDMLSASNGGDISISAVTPRGYIGQMTYGTITSSNGSFGGSITLNSDTPDLGAVWRVQLEDGATTSAYFKLELWEQQGRWTANPITLSSNTSATEYHFGRVLSGTYNFRITPTTPISGTYKCGIWFYAH